MRSEGKERAGPAGGGDPAVAEGECLKLAQLETQLSKVVDRAAKGESFIIAKAGKPLVKVSALDSPKKPKRLGFLKGEIEVPDDFDRMFETEIAAMFGVDE